MSANPVTVRQLERAIHDTLGRPYQINWSKLEERELREVQRLLRDVETDLQLARRRHITYRSGDDS